ncbi:MAG: hypothetical protein EBR86_13920 [Planctomycetia bacterium]|nr:hypothetical protein [Planctomycetia bacterium]
MRRSLADRGAGAWEVSALAFLMHLAASPLLPAAEPVATPAASVRVPPGFRAELVRSAAPGEDSWISMTFDPQGRVIVGLDERGVGRLAPGADGTWSFERLDDSLRHCRGVLHAHGALYVSATDSRELWRLVDGDGDGRYEERRLLKAFDYRSRYGHGTNQLVAGPDGMLYLMVGNDVSFPEGMAAASPYRGPHTDRLLPDPHDAGQDDRVGYLLRFDPLGTEWTVVAGGFRNQVDVVFSPDGEAFTWDADMEWDVGMPWYRPTRVNHVVSGGEYGWRWGTAKWPVHFADSLPTTLDTGLGSPTGLAFAAGSRFPAPWRECLFMADWQHGKILAVALEPEGASYRATDRLFAAGAPLNVCDMAFGPDGNLWLVTGGRRSQSGLYRIVWEGGDTAGGSDAGLPVAPPEQVAAAAIARQRRRALERFHGVVADGAVDALWADLGSSDRWLRGAARVALEHQPLAAWRSRVDAENDPLRRATALLAWIRVAPDAAARGEVLAAWRARPVVGDETTTLCLLRVLAIALARGVPLDDQQRAALVAAVRGIDAAPLSAIDRQRAELLVALADPGAVELILGRLRADASQEDQIQLVHALVRHPGPWTGPQREAVLRWFVAARRFTGGHLLPKVLGQMTDDFLASLTAAEREVLAEPLAALTLPAGDAPTAEPAPVRPFVRHWTVDDVGAALAGMADRDPAAGRRALAAGQCLKCHRFAGTGTAIGPDLSAVGGRFDRRTLAESIIDPGRVVDPKYQVTTWVLADGRAITGRAAQVGAAEITVETDPLRGAVTKIVRAEIESAHPAAVSPMPSGLLDTLTLDEILDLVALLAPAAAAPPAGAAR